MDRRTFIKLAGVAATTPALASLISALDDAPARATAPSKVKKKPVRPVKLGFIALTDCASLVMAKELGYFAERDLDVTLEKQASWPATRDALLNGQIDGAHCLFGMPFSVATGIGGTAGNTALKIAMVLSNNGQAITLKKDYVAAGYGNLAKVKKVLEAKTPTMAMTFPGGTHDIWLRYWLRAAKVDASAVKIIPIPPPQMVANMNVGTMDGYCVGEPWNAVAVDQNIGFTAITSQDIWTNHPEKALVVNEKFAADKTDTLKDVMAAVLKASKWLDVRKNRSQAASVVGVPQYVNALASAIEGRLEGKYQLGAGLGAKTFTNDYMVFHRNGEVNAPRHAHAIWFMAQYRRLGLLSTDPDYTKIANAIILRDLYESVAKAEKIAVPGDDMAPFTVKLDNATFDPKKPAAEVKRA
ncbi:MAG TPA: CmpA/NrtA family ABC transporter substrate-binding protein [Acidimicrobiia bacterium]